MNHPTITAHNYSSDRSSAEAISVGLALESVRRGDCKSMRVIRELDALEAMLAAGESDDEEVASAERDLHAAWQEHQRACGQ
jgi:hypothetical protein